MAQIAQIWIYPIKSCRGISLTESDVDPRGLTWDRRWVLADEAGVFLTQRSTRALGEFQPRLSQDGLWITHIPSNEEIWLPFPPETSEECIIQIWEDQVPCLRVSDALDNWFSHHIQQKVRLFFQPDQSIRPIEAKYQLTGAEHTSLSDGYPILVLSEASLEKISQEAGKKMDVLRFRPNLVLQGLEAFGEDNLTKFWAGSAELACVKPCARCVLTTVDPTTLEAGPEPLKSLAHYRKQNQKIMVGQNTVVLKTGVLRVGDVIRMQEDRQST